MALPFSPVAAAIAASLATWAVDDPSLSHATDRAARNVLGLPGAIVADIFMQFFGLASIALLCLRSSGDGVSSSTSPRASIGRR